MTHGAKAVHEFVTDLDYDDLPTDVVVQARRCLLDLMGVAAAGSSTRLAHIVREHAADNFGSRRRTARLWFDGRAVGPAGAAFANAATIDAMDGHDGHRLTKGHAGVAVLPAALAVLETNLVATLRDLLTALVVGYETATRAGVALHSTAADFHSSGAWNAVGAAAVSARALRLGPDETAHALGIAEYLGPRAPMMRCITHPTMVKDSSGWGAHVGVNAALLAADGFTGAPAELLSAPGWSDLGDRWLVLEHYFKAYPVCGWAHPAIEATIRLVRENDIQPDDIEAIEIDTFAAATELTTTRPTTTEQAQYSLSFPVALAAVRRAVVPEVVAHPETAVHHVRRLADTMSVRADPAMTAAFPARRYATATLHLVGGDKVRSGRVTAEGGQERPLSTDALVEKFRVNTHPVLGADRAEQLLGRLLSAGDQHLNDVVDDVC